MEGDRAGGSVEAGAGDAGSAAATGGGEGVCQGCMLSPWLFNFYAEYIMRNAGLEEACACTSKSIFTLEEKSAQVIADYTPHSSDVSAF